MPRALAWFCTFFFINLTWVFFRAEDTESAFRVLNSMFSMRDFGLSLVFMDQASSFAGVDLRGVFSLSSGSVMVSEISLLASALALVAVLTGKNMMERQDQLLAFSGVTLKTMLFYSLVAMVALWVMVTSSSEVFLYFNF